MWAVEQAAIEIHCYWFHSLNANSILHKYTIKSLTPDSVLRFKFFFLKMMIMMM